MGKTCLMCGKEIPNRNKYCSNQCQNDYEHAQWIERWKQGLESGVKGAYGISVHIKRYLFDKFENKCAKCKWSEINPFTNTLPLEIHHIDGNYLNNKEDNLVVLCPNCHSLEEHHKGANKGNGRTSR